MKPGNLAEASRSIGRLTVDSSGVVEELDDAGGVRFVRLRPEIVAYAKGLLASDRDSVRFVWIELREWFAIAIEVDRSNFGGPHALVAIRRIDAPFGLTSRELDVLTLISAGLGNPQISERLGTGIRTVTKHVENIFLKTSISTRAGAAGMALDLGLLRLPAPGGVELVPLAVGVVERAAKAVEARVKRPTRSLTRRPIIVGAPLSLTGMASTDAREMLNGASLAISEINERGGVNGRELQLLTADCDISDPRSVVSAYRSLVEAEVDALTSGYSSAEMAVQDIVSDYGCPYLHATTMESVVDRVRQDPVRFGNIFQVCPSDIHYGPGLARFLADMEQQSSWRPRNRRLVVLQPNWPGMDVGLPAMERLLGPLGWTVDVISDLPLQGIDWRHVVQRLHGADPSVVMLAYYFPEESIAFQRAFGANPLPALVYTLYAPSIPAFREELGDLAEGLVWATTTGLYADRIGRDFAGRYRERHGVSPGRSHASIAYDRINILANSWARVGNSRAFRRVAEDIRSVVHRGVNGAYFFGSTGQVGLAFPDNTLDPSISQAHLVFQIQDGRQRILAPQPYGDASLQTPPWFAESA